ncbi:MAG: hypothetical protein WD381_04855 [Balneolaceae bacterium]
MKKTIKYILSAFLLLAVTELSNAQNSSTAVMEVKVEVISGSSIVMNNFQQLEPGWETYSNAKSFKVGDFSVSLPDGVVMISELNDELNLTNGATTVELSTDVHQRNNNDGSITFEVTGKTEGKAIGEGHYSGRKVATIQYL